MQADPAPVTPKPVEAVQVPTPKPKIDLKKLKANALAKLAQSLAVKKLESTKLVAPVVQSALQSSAAPAPAPAPEPTKP